MGLPLLMMCAYISNQLRFICFPVIMVLLCGVPEHVTFHVLSLRSMHYEWLTLACHCVGTLVPSALTVVMLGESFVSLSVCKGLPLLTCFVLCRLETALGPHQQI